MSSEEIETGLYGFDFVRF